jgi:hypothetical protein
MAKSEEYDFARSRALDRQCPLTLSLHSLAQSAVHGDHEQTPNACHD